MPELVRSSIVVQRPLLLIAARLGMSVAWETTDMDVTPETKGSTCASEADIVNASAVPCILTQASSGAAVRRGGARCHREVLVPAWGDIAVSLIEVQLYRGTAR